MLQETSFVVRALFFEVLNGVIHFRLQLLVALNNNGVGHFKLVVELLPGVIKTLKLGFVLIT
jgi:hypothetical protein